MFVQIALLTGNWKHAEVGTFDAIFWIVGCLAAEAFTDLDGPSLRPLVPGRPGALE